MLFCSHYVMGYQGIKPMIVILLAITSLISKIVTSRLRLVRIQSSGLITITD
jgi:hypothetical protein